MLKVKNITKLYQNGKGVKNISFKILKPQVVGLLGPNGAGKTTTLKMLAGAFLPDTGEVLINNKSITLKDLTAKKYIGYLPEDNPLYSDLLVGEYLDVVFQLKGLVKNRKKQILRVVKNTGIQDIYYQKIKTLSKGLKQRVGLAQALLGNPKILLLDEPTEGLDPNQRTEIRSLIKKLGKDRIVIISSHVLSEIKEMCKRVIIINKGGIAKDDNIENLLDQNTKMFILNTSDNALAKDKLQ